MCVSLPFLSSPSPTITDNGPLSPIIRTFRWSKHSARSLKSRISRSSPSMRRYVFVKRSSHLPLFNETFYNYGYNKVQWIEHLRYSGYKFGQLINGFGIDVPHPPYLCIGGLECSRNQMAMKWLEKLHTPEGPPLKQEYDVFRNRRGSINRISSGLCTLSRIDPLSILIAQNLKKKCGSFKIAFFPSLQVFFFFLNVCFS